MFLLVGSAAAKERLPNFREPSDIDYFSTRPMETYEVISGKKVEFFYHPALSEWILNHGLGYAVASLDELYTIKVSHAYWDLRNGSWAKHVSDMVKFKRAGAKLIPETHDLLYAVWEEMYGKKRANLNATPQEFFNNQVHRVYEHDSIHASVAFYDEPMFNLILKDGESVAVDKGCFMHLDWDDKIRLCEEEIFATALERRVIPSNYTGSPLAAYTWALKRLITSMTKGWFAQFLVENYDVLRRPSIDYVARHKENAHKLVRITE